MPLRPVDDPNPFSLSGPVGHLAENARADVIKAQMLLAEAGYLDLPEPGLPTGWPGSGLVPGIKRLQRDRGRPARCRGRQNGPGPDTRGHRPAA